MSRRALWLLGLGLALQGGAACEARRSDPTPTTAARPAARAPRAPSAPESLAVTAAERAHDAARQEPAAAVLAELDATAATLDAWAAGRGRAPHTRAAWPAAREALLVRVAALRRQILGIDPLARRSAFAREASALAAELAVALPDAAAAALADEDERVYRGARAAFDLRRDRLRRYVHSLRAAGARR